MGRVRQLLHLALEETCLGGGAYVGNAMLSGYSCTHGDFSYYDDIRQCCEWLDERGRAWMQGDDHGAAGPCGWLDWVETSFLVDALRPLPLPRIEAGFDAIREARADDSGTFADEQGQLCVLAVVRAVATLATERGQGLLWGWDLTTPLV